MMIIVPWDLEDLEGEEGLILTNPLCPHTTPTPHLIFLFIRPLPFLRQ